MLDTHLEKGLEMNWLDVMFGIGTILAITIIVVSVILYFRKQPDPKEIKTRIDAMNLQFDSFLYIMADDGKDTVVNRHLQRRADHLEKHAAKMRERANNR